MKSKVKIGGIGFLAGCVNGLLGAGGGMILVPCLSRTKLFKEKEIFPASLSIMLPICIVSILFTGNWAVLSLFPPYLMGSFIGGLGAGLCTQKIPLKWLHKILGILIIGGGIRNII